MFTSRIFLGIGIGLINAKAISIFSEYYEGREKAALLGYRGSAEVLGSAVMTLVAGKLVLIRWNLAFWVYALGFVIVLLYLVWVPGNMEMGQSAGSQSAGGEKESLEAEEDGKRKCWKKEVLPIAYALFAGFVICIYCSNSLRVPMLILEKKLGTESEASIILTLMMLMGIAAGVYFGKLTMWWKEKLPGVGCLMLGAGMLLTAYAGNLPLIGIGISIVGFFYTVLVTYSFHQISEQIPQSSINTATSIVLVGCNLGALAKTAAGSYKPVITAWVSDRIALSVRKQLRSVPNAPISAIQSPVAAALAFGYLAAEARRRADRLSIPPEWSVELNPAKLAEARAIVNGARLEGRHALSPSETGRLLACFEIPAVPLREVGTLEEAGAAADELGWPVALKVTAPGLRHKSDIGGVVLDIKDRDGLAAAWRSMAESLVNNSPMTPMVGAVVQKMVPHSSVRELHLAIAYDNVLGPVVEFGAGGIGSKLYQDKKAALVPITLSEADRLVESTRIARALGTYRGLAPADRTLIAQMLCRLSVLAALIPAIRDLTINPLVWTDGGAAAIDADVHLNEAPVESEPGYPHLTVCAPPWEEGREVVFGGEALTLRTFVQSDFHPLKRFLGRLSEKTFYLRFHTSVHLSDERICELASLDYAREAAWALAKDGEIHAVARWRLTGELGEAEFGIVVEDAWQRRGLARVLMAHIETTASERGVTRLVGHVLKGNEAMQGMMTAMGYTLGEGDSRDTDPWVKDISIPTNLL